jgi:hypothetical protein
MFGVHVALGRTGPDAKAEVRDRITETYLGEGLSASAARRAASSYGVFVIAGGLGCDEAREARQAWDLDDSQPVIRLARRYRSRWSRKIADEYPEASGA